MGASQKKLLLNVTYYTLIAVMIAFVIFYFITLGNASMAEWERVCFYVITALLVVAVVFDIYCTCTHTSKYISGFVLYGITLATIIISLIVMALNASSGRLLLDITERFFRVILFTYLINALAIIIYLAGQKVISIVENREKK